MPLKQAILAQLDSVHRAAAEIGAVNLVRHGADGRLHGRNSDVEGIWRALDTLPTGKSRAVLLGAGGAARAAAYALRRIGFTSLHIMARNAAAAGQLATDLFPTATIGDWSRLPAADLLVNATPLGMHGHPWPDLSLDPLPEDATVFDMVYAPARTPLLASAKARGLRTIGGASMLLHQAAVGFATLFEAKAPRDTFDTLAEELGE
jgi:shikimate dehydrogenase